MKMKSGMNGDSNLSQSEDSHRTTTLTDNKKRDYENERSSMHDDSCIGINRAHAHKFSKCFKSLHRFHRSIMSFCTSLMCGLFIELLWAPPGIAPLPPTGGRTRWLVPILILPEWHWPELSFTRFLVKMVWCGQRVVELRTILQWSRCSGIIGRNPPIPSVSKVFCLRHMMAESFLRKGIHLDTDLFISIMVELRCMKFRIVLKTMVVPLKMPLDASLSQIMCNIMISSCFSFPISMAMKSSLLDDIVWNWEMVQCTLNGASAGFASDKRCAQVQ